MVIAMIKLIFVSMFVIHAKSTSDNSSSITHQRRLPPRFPQRPEIETDEEVVQYIGNAKKVDLFVLQHMAPHPLYGRVGEYVPECLSKIKPEGKPAKSYKCASPDMIHDLNRLLKERLQFDVTDSIIGPNGLITAHIWLK